MELATSVKRGTKRHSAASRSDYIGMCLSCNRRLTYCGKPFTAQIVCRNCLSINVYEQSLKPARLEIGLVVQSAA